MFAGDLLEILIARSEELLDTAYVNNVWYF